MASYVEHSSGLVVQARQLVEDHVYDNPMGQFVGRAGEWEVRYPDGTKSVCPDAAFRQRFSQMFPRLAGKALEPVIPNSPMTA